MQPLLTYDVQMHYSSIFWVKSRKYLFAASHRKYKFFVNLVNVQASDYMLKIAFYLKGIQENLNKKKTGTD